MPDDGQFQINDLFWTLQGEGHFSGRRALFIRLPFCNYHCPWCDTEFNSFKKWSEQQLISFMEKESGRFAVLTGGEPLIHKDLLKILKLLKKKMFLSPAKPMEVFPPQKKLILSPPLQKNTVEALLKSITFIPRFKIAPMNGSMWWMNVLILKNSKDMSLLKRMFIILCLPNFLR